MLMGNSVSHTIRVNQEQLAIKAIKDLLQVYQNQKFLKELDKELNHTITNSASMYHRNAVNISFATNQEERTQTSASVQLVDLSIFKHINSLVFAALPSAQTTDEPSSDALWYVAEQELLAHIQALSNYFIQSGSGSILRE